LPQQEKGKRSGMIQNTSGGTNERQIHWVYQINR
jgi:hypothetical protein